MLGTLIPFAFAQAQTETPGDDTAPARHAAGSLDEAELLLLQLEANAELISLELEETAFFLIFRPGVAPVPVGNLVIMRIQVLAQAGPSKVRPSAVIFRRMAGIR